GGPLWERGTHECDRNSFKQKANQGHEAQSRSDDGFGGGPHPWLCSRGNARSDGRAGDGGIPMKTNLLAVTLALLAATALTSAANAQETTGAPGSPSATTTMPGNQLPPPPQKFEGKIERNAAQSTPWWPARVVPPKGAPCRWRC